MPRIDPTSALPRIELHRYENTFTDPRSPETEFPFVFAFPDVRSEADDLLLMDARDTLIDRHITQGIPVHAGGRALPIGQRLCWRTANFMQAERNAAVEEPWSAEQWFAFAVLAPDAWNALTDWYFETFAKLYPDPTAAGEDEDKPKNA